MPFCIASFERHFVQRVLAVLHIIMEPHGPGYPNLLGFMPAQRIENMQRIMNSLHISAEKAIETLNINKRHLSML